MYSDVCASVHLCLSGVKVTCYNVLVSTKKDFTLIHKTYIKINGISKTKQVSRNMSSFLTLFHANHINSMKTDNI